MASRGKERRTARNAERSGGKHGASWTSLAVALALVVAVLVAYAPTLDNDFVSWDDPTYVLERPEVLNPSAAGDARLWRMPVSLNYHPLTMRSLAWNSRNAPRVGPLRTPDPHGFILTNIWLHALNSLLVFVFVLGLSRTGVFPAAFTAMVFALHPMHVESVAWVSERKDVLYTFFLLGALIGWSRWGRSGQWWWYALALVLFIASCLAKAMAVVLPVLLVLVDAWEQRPLRSIRPWLEKLTFFGVALLFGLIALDVQSGGDFHGLLEVDRALGVTGAVAEKLPYTGFEQFRFGAYGYVMYLVRLFWPGGFSTFHPYPEGDDRPLLFLAAPVLMPAVLLAGALLWRRSQVVGLGLLFFTVCVLPVLQFLPVGRAVMAERYTYIAYIGPAFALGMLLQQALSARARMGAWMIGAVAVPGLLLLAITRVQADVWQSTATLFGQVIERYPKAPDGYSILGSWYGKRSAQERAPALLDSAGLVLRQGVKAGARSGPLFEALATYYGSKGRTDSALVWFDRAVTEGPVTGQLMHNRAMARYASDPEGCAADLAKAIALGHTRVGESYALRARDHFRAQRFAEALADMDTAIRRFGHQRADAFLLRGLAAYQLGRKAEARSDAEQALRMDPRSAQARELLRATE